jgi:hypothetical protein
LGTFLASADTATFLSRYVRPWAGWNWVGWAMIVVGGLAYIPMVVASVWRSKSLTKLENRITDLEEALNGVASDVQKVLDKQLFAIAQELKLETTERVTVYAYGGSEFFTPLARYSPNAVYREKSRKIYQSDGGAIASAWADRWYFRNDYPDPRNPTAWVSRCVRDKLDEKVAQGIRMKAQLYAGHRVDSPNGDFLAVVILESTRRDRYTEDALRSFFEGRGNDLLRPHLEHFASSLPRATNAREEGF